MVSVETKGTRSSQGSLDMIRSDSGTSYHDPLPQFDGSLAIRAIKSLYVFQSTGDREVSTVGDEDIQERFRELTDQWKFDTGHLSVASKIAMHPAYQRIIAMGEQAIPYILSDLQQESHHWFWALSVITDDAPTIPDDDKGNIRAMSNAWIEWGRRKQYID